MVNTPAQPILGSVNFAANGVQTPGNTVRMIPYSTMARPMPNSVSWVFFFSGTFSTAGARKWEKKASAPPMRSRTSARKSNALPAASADPMGTKTDAVPFAV